MTAAWAQVGIAPAQPTTPETASTSAASSMPLNAVWDTLPAVMVEAYEGNPLLTARRYEQRAVDDAVGVALSELRPQAQAQIGGGYEFTDPGRITQASRPLVDRLNSPYIERNDLTGQIIVDQPLLTGGRAWSAIRAARADVRAGQQALRGAEGDLLINLIAAYADIRRDEEALLIRQTNLATLGKTLDEVVARREAGELTRTDIAQAQTQLRAAQVQLNATIAQLAQSRAAFDALVGRPPRSLAPEPTLPGVPESLGDALDAAEQHNPELAQAIETERASRARIAQARAEGRPAISLRGIAGATGPISPYERRNMDMSLSGRATLTIPLSAGGRVRSQTAQALDRNSADQARIEAARRDMVEQIVAAWNQMEAAGRNREAQAAQLDAAQIYYEGSVEEYRAGLRSTFDVLYAQNALRETQIALRSSERDHYVAQASLLRRIGGLELSQLIAAQGLYAPEAHAREAAARSATPLDLVPRLLDAVSAPSSKGKKPRTPDVRPADPALDHFDGTPARPATHAKGRR